MDEQISSVQEGTAERLVELKVKAVLENVPRVTRIVAQAATQLGFEESALYQIELAVDEACANVVEHAYPHDERGEMEVVCFLHARHLVIRVRDWGSGFDLGAVDEPDVSAPLEDRGLGGLGLFLVRQVMDGVRFHFDPEAGNELFMVKRLDVAA
ncbi:MAG: ATP-binding protein [Anaerolineae bacterium]|jgi:serine/threonine-protein kinase RsbW